MSDVVIGYKASVSKNGIHTDITDVPMVLYKNNTFHTVDNTTRVFSYKSPIEVKVNGVVVPTTDYTIDHLFGRITFTTLPTDPVTITGKYVPVQEIISAHKMDLKINAEPVDVTTFFSARRDHAFKRKIAGLKTVDISIDTFYIVNAHLLDTFLKNEPVFIEVRPSVDHDLCFRGWFNMTNKSIDVDVKTIVTSALQFSLYEPKGISKYFSYEEIA